MDAYREIWVRNWFDGGLVFSKVGITGHGSGRHGNVLDQFEADHISGDNGSSEAIQWARDLVNELNNGLNP